MATERLGHDYHDGGSNKSQDTPERTRATDEDERRHRPKRRRVSRACDRCRHSKLKCNGALPQCGPCVKVGKPCLYGATMRRRGLRTGYVRALECLWGLVFQSIEGSETTVETLIAATSRKSFWVRDDMRDGSKGGKTPWETWKSSRVPHAIDTVLSANDNTDEEDPTSNLPAVPDQAKNPSLNWSVHGLSPSSSRAPPSSASQVLCQQCSAEAQEPAKLPDNTTASQSQMPLHKPVFAHQETQGSLPELPPNPVQLLNRYFSFTHSWLPIVERPAVYRSFFAYSMTPADQISDKRVSGETAVLWAIFAYVNKVHGSVNVGNEDTQLQQQEKLYTVARMAIPLEKEKDGSYSTGHVEALLILGLLHYTFCEWHTARNLVGKAILLASHSGLDQPGKCLIDQHRRVWLGSFVLDTLISAHTDTFPLLRPDHVKAFLPLNEGAADEWEPWNLHEALLPGIGAEMAELAAPTHALTVFSALTELICIMNDWICSRGIQRNHRTKRAISIWIHNLPEHIKMQVENILSTPSTLPPPNMVNLIMIHAVLVTETGCPELQTLLSTMDIYSGRFDQHVVPPTFNLLRNILPQQMETTGAICDLVAEVKKLRYGGVTGQSRANVEGANNASTEDPVSTAMPFYHKRAEASVALLFIRLIVFLFALNSLPRTVRLIITVPGQHYPIPPGSQSTTTSTH